MNVRICGYEKSQSRRRMAEYLRFIESDSMEPSMIFETSFNHHHELGVAGIFGDALSQQIIEHIHDVNQNAGVVAAKS